MLIVVGGHSRNIGKTSVACALIQATTDAQWTAVKITQHGHSICSDAGVACDCAPGDSAHPWALNEQFKPSGTDTGRYLAAGAKRAFWLRTAQGELGHGMPALREILAGSENTILESNSVLRFLRPDLYLVVLDFAVTDFKESARYFLDRADALVVVRSAAAEPEWPDVSRRMLARHRVIAVSPPEYGSAELVGMLRRQLAAGRTISTTAPVSPEQ